MPTYGKSHDTKSLQFDAGAPAAFDNVASVGANVASTTVQARLPVSQRVRIYKVVVNYSAINVADGTHKFNIVVGTGAEGSVGSVDTVAVAGTTVFAADQGLTATADTPQVFYPPVWDTIYDTGSLLTLRAVTPASTGSITNLKVTLYVKSSDASPVGTEDPNSDGTYGFSNIAF